MDFIVGYFFFLFVIFILIYLYNKPSIKNDSSSSLDNLDSRDTNEQSFFDKKVINEHIKLLNQNLLAMVFLRSGYEKKNSFRALGETQDMWSKTNTSLENFLQRDLTKEEIEVEFETNMFVRRVYDEMKLNSSLGKFDKVINPEYGGNDSWETVINEYRSEMVWVK